MKFKVGDSFEVIDNGQIGQICDILTKVELDIITGTPIVTHEYQVRWCGRTDYCQYRVEDCDPIWREKPNAMGAMPPRATVPQPYWIQMMKNSIAEIKGDTSWESKKTDHSANDNCSLNHDWKVYDSGFTRFEYCSRCNKENR